MSGTDRLFSDRVIAVKIAQTPVMSVVYCSAYTGSLDVHLPSLNVDRRHHAEGQSAQSKSRNNNKEEKLTASHKR